MADWSTIASLATAAGTLVLAAATFSSVRSARLSTRVTERALRISLRPVLVPSRFDDPPEKVGFADNQWVRVEGGRAGVVLTNDAVYLVLPLRNVGAGLAVLDRWSITASDMMGHPDHEPIESYRRLTRDLYVAPGDRGFWQGALRDPSEPIYGEVVDAIRHHRPLSVEVLYGDHEGGQGTITRFGLRPYGEDLWIAAASRYWYLDPDIHPR
jgi:hypothetical protein